MKLPENLNISLPENPIEKGTLYIVSTPIGNLEDISLRALSVLENVDLILAEDTRVTINLLNEYGIKNRIQSFHAHSDLNAINDYIALLKEGKSIALVTDAGTPLISDPGYPLVSACINEDINLTSVPGANALITGLIQSGYDNDNFYFQGFLPVKGRENLFLELKSIKMPIVIYESKFRINKTVQEIQHYFGNVEITVCRELTKKFEETIRGHAKEIASSKRIKEKGEFVIIINNS